MGFGLWDPADFVSLTQSDRGCEMRVEPINPNLYNFELQLTTLNKKEFRLVGVRLKEEHE